MKNKVTLLLFFSILIYSISSEDIVHNYQSKLYKTIPAGSDKKNLWAAIGGMPSGPSDYIITDNDFFIIADSYNHRINKYDEKINYLETIFDYFEAGSIKYSGVFFPQFIFTDSMDNSLILISSLGLYKIRNNKIIYFKDEYQIPRSIKNGYCRIINGNLVYHDDQKQLMACDSFGNILADNDINILIEASNETLSDLLVEDHQKFDKIKKYIADNKILFLGGRLFVPQNDYKVYFQYWNLLRNSMSNVKLKDRVIINYNLVTSFSFRGYDKFNNNYWSALYYKNGINWPMVVIYSQFGEAIDIFYINSSGFKVAPYGDIFEMEVERKEIKFKHVKQRWLTNENYSTHTIISLNSSSMRTEKRDKNMYQPVKAFDGKSDTGWMESAKGSGLGEWIEVKFDKPVTADKLVISAGWFDKRYWARNNRIKSLRIELDDYSRDAPLADKMTAQEVKLPAAKTFSRAKFIVKDVYPSGQDDDTCISEIEFWNGGKKLELDLSAFADQMKVVPE